MTDEGLKLAAQVVSTMFSAAFAITAIVFQINGFPITTIIRALKTDLDTHGALTILFCTLALQIIAVNFEQSPFKCFVIRINPVLVVIEFATLGYLIFKMVDYLEIGNIAHKLGRELVEHDLGN